MIVPDFVGMSLGQAIHAARKSGVELAFDDPEGTRDRRGAARSGRARAGAAGCDLPVAFGRR